MLELTHFLKENPVLLIFATIAAGYPLGRLTLRGISPGVAAILFAGLGIGALFPDVKPPEAIHILGLSIFVYSVGLASAGTFVSSLRQDGIRANITALASLGIAACTCGLVAHSIGAPAASAAGAFTGALTNTPALASVVETLRLQSGSQATLPVVAYSVAYPFAIIVSITAIAVSGRLLRRHWAPEPAAEGVEIATILVHDSDYCNRTLGGIVADEGLQVTFGRIVRGSEELVALPSRRLRPGDLLTVVGAGSELERTVQLLGELSDVSAQTSSATLDSRRIFVSNRRLAGRTIGSLGLAERFGGRITRIRRGDEDIVPDDGFVLELGDRVRVIAPRERLGEASAFFGDSYHALSEVDILTFAVGHALGLLLGALPLPWGLRLGFAGGPLLVALVLGSMRRTGRLVWQVPYSANLTMRQLGLVLFLAGIGLRAGAGLATVDPASVLGLAAIGVGTSLIAVLAALMFCCFWLRYPLGKSAGVVSGIFTQPATLAWSQETFSGSEPQLGYSMVYPVAMVGKIVIAQALLTLMTS